jgi:hypothetical protein
VGFSRELWMVTPIRGHRSRRSLTCQRNSCGRWRNSLVSAERELSVR